MHARQPDGTRRTTIVVSMTALLVNAGCATEDPAQALATLLGDLARQLLTFWVL
jgi:hypothetical protein